MKAERFFAGIDGEGKDDPPEEDQERGHHRYVLLAWSDEYGNRSSYIEDPRGLSTADCLEFLFEEIPDHARLFAYSMNYDLTMMLKDLGDRQLYRLFRPEFRKRKPAPDGSPRPPYPVAFRANGWTYHLNYQGSKFSVRRGSERRLIWDVFKFFQGKFTAALDDWKVGTDKERAEIAKMKEQRGEFDKLHMHDVTHYCFSECRKLAELVRKLTDAHTMAGLELKAYHGAGSTTTAMFKVMEIGDKIRPPPAEMTIPVACGFFGGRFEHAVLGAIEGPVWSYDISSAYPYEMTNLPCLLHARWERTKSVTKMMRARHALVRYSLGEWRGAETAWAPFPFREETGAIVYPLTSGGGWIWREEFLAGADLFNHVVFEEAWIMHTDCHCKPFKRLPEWYSERLRIGKEGPGIVLKLGMNGGYGKTAQSIGTAPFQSWVWAGMITSGTRAQILRALGAHRDRSNLLSVATDGIYSLEQLDLQRPRDTGTNRAFDHEDCCTCGEKHGPPACPGRDLRYKPLGGWERKVIPPPGVFFARPGMYWPLDPSVKVKLVRARGVGRAVLYNNRERVARAFLNDEAWIELPDVVRFRGAKTGISADREAIVSKGKRGEVKRSPAYGEWESRPTIVSFDPRPKREGDYERRGRFAVLTCRKLGNVTSAPYDRAKQPAEVAAMKSLADELLEQPNGDFEDVREQYQD